MAQDCPRLILGIGTQCLFNGVHDNVALYWVVDRTPFSRQLPLYALEGYQTIRKGIWNTSGHELKIQLEFIELSIAVNPCHSLEFH